MAGGLAMLDFITRANEFGYSQVQYAIKFAETCNSLFRPSNRQVIITYLLTGDNYLLTYLLTHQLKLTSLHWQQQQKLKHTKYQCVIN